MRLVLIVLFVPAVAGAERVAVVGDAGIWATGGSAHEVHAGADTSIEWPAGHDVVLGLAGDAQRVWYADDECYGFHGVRGDAVGFIGIDAQDPSVAWLRWIVQARAGVAWLHAAPYCSNAPPARDNLGIDLAGVVGFDLGPVRVHAIVARPTYWLPNEPLEVTVGVGAAW